jgi:hypothetical protein
MTDRGEFRDVLAAYPDVKVDRKTETQDPDPSLHAVVRTRQSMYAITYFDSSPDVDGDPELLTRVEANLVAMRVTAVLSSGLGDEVRWGQAGVNGLARCWHLYRSTCSCKFGRLRGLLATTRASGRFRCWLTTTFLLAARGARTRSGGGGRRRGCLRRSCVACTNRIVPTAVVMLWS